MAFRSSHDRILGCGRVTKELLLFGNIRDIDTLPEEQEHLDQVIPEFGKQLCRACEQVFIYSSESIHVM